jgi:hypothetical protein
LEVVCAYVTEGCRERIFDSALRETQRGRGEEKQKMRDRGSEEIGRLVMRRSQFP